MAKGPEKLIEEKVMSKLRSQQWFVQKMHGNLYQYGVPDLYVAHKSYGTRWVELKNPGKFAFTPAQLIRFKEMNAAGVGIWVVTSEVEVPALLFKPQQWYMYLDPLYAKVHS